MWVLNKSLLLTPTITEEQLQNVRKLGELSHMQPDSLNAQVEVFCVDFPPESQERRKIAFAREKSIYSVKQLTIWYRDVSN